MIQLLAGENTFEISRRVQAIATQFDGEVERIDGAELTLEQLPDLLAGVTLFSTKRLVIIRQASQNKPVWAVLGEWLEKGVDNDIVLVETNPDKRTKTYKWLEKHADVAQAHLLQPREAVTWVGEAGKDIGLSREVAEFLVDYVGADQWRLASELEKLRLSGEKPTKTLVERLVEPTPQATVFELLDAAFRGQTAKFDGLFETVSRYEDPYMFFGLVAGQVYALAVAAYGRTKRPEDIAKEAGVHPFVIKKVSGLASQLGPKDVRQLVGRLAELDAHMKSRAVDPWTQIRSFLMSL